MKERFLVIGGAGFLGQHLVRALSEKGIVAVLDPEPAARQLGELSNVRVLQESLLNSERLSRLLIEIQPSAIIHLAAITGIAKCAQQPRECFELNVYGTYLLVKAIIESGLPTRLVFASSREVYGETLGPATEEDDPKIPKNLYGLTKLLGEEIIQWAAASHHARATILRFTNLYGPGGDRYATAVFVKSALRGKPITMMGGDQVFNLLYIDDAVRAIELALENPENGIFNIGSDDNITIRDLVKQIIELTNADVVVVPDQMRHGETNRFVPSCARSKDLLGFSALVPLAEGLRRTIEYYRSQMK
jgi:UDP-glucose 4-epimerase